MPNKDGIVLEKGRTSGDGMEQDDIGKSEHKPTFSKSQLRRKDSSIQETVHQKKPPPTASTLPIPGLHTLYRPTETSRSLPAVKPRGELRLLTPRLVDVRDTPEHKRTKPPRFIPFEPYTGAVNPIVPNKDSSNRVLKKDRNNLDIGVLVSHMSTMRVQELHESSKESENEPEQQKTEDPEIAEMKAELQKVKEERDHFQSQLKFQAQVNSELKNLLVASVGEDLLTKVNVLTEDKLQLARALLDTAHNLTTHTLDVCNDKVQNVKHALSEIAKVVDKCKPRVAVLPESFNCPYGIKYFREFCEKIPGGYTSQRLSECAKEHDMYIIGGTIPEKDENDCIFNTCTVWHPCGSLLAKYRQMHMSDIDIPDGLGFRKADKLSAGDELKSVQIDGHRIGLGISYDLRFEELARIHRDEGCKMLVYPAAFNTETGPMHFELLQRARATDNQVYVVTVSSSRDESADYSAYGYSMVVDPWAKVIANAKESEETLVVDINFNLVEKVRKHLPISKQRRLDIYITSKRKCF